MTAACGGGTSAANATYNTTIAISTGMISGLLNNIPTPWAVALGGLIGAFNVYAPTFCASDPPAIPTFTADDVAALLNPIIVDQWLAAQQKFRDLLLHYLWFQFCDCTTGTKGSPGAPPSAPANMPLINPPAIGPSYPTGQPCGVLTYDISCVAPNSVPNQPPIVPVPVGTTHIAIQCEDNTTFSGGEGGWQINTQCFNASGTFLGNPCFPGHSSTGSNMSQGPTAVPAGTVSVRAAMSNFNNTHNFTVHADIQLYCGAPGGGIVQQPCPTDPYTLQMLDQILALVQLIQREQVPFGYISGATHSVSGNGTISVQGLIGAKVLLTATPSFVGFEDGDPLTVFEAGWINWGNADGFSERLFISASPMVSLPAAAGQYTRIGYSLSPGVTADITELFREH